MGFTFEGNILKYLYMSDNKYTIWCKDSKIFTEEQVTIILSSFIGKEVMSVELVKLEEINVYDIVFNDVDIAKILITLEYMDRILGASIDTNKEENIEQIPTYVGDYFRVTNIRTSSFTVQFNYKHNRRLYQFVEILKRLLYDTNFIMDFGPSNVTMVNVIIPNKVLSPREIYDMVDKIQSRLRVMF